MISMKRTFGKLGKRSDNTADVQSVLDEFKAVDDMLDRLIKDIKAWKTAWEDVLKFQYDSSEAYANLYKPIEPTNDPEMRHQPVETPTKYMQKCLTLQKEYDDEKSDLAQEIGLIATRCLRPADEAKQHTKLLQKTLKHRENMKLDYERYLSRAEHVRKKEQRNPKEEAALAQHESNLAQAQISYETADEQIRETIPPVSAAILSLLPYILANQVMLQTTLVGQLYTVLDSYTRKFGFPNPAPPDTEIVSSFDNEFTSLRKELEGGLKIISTGKAVHMGMHLPDKDKSTVSGMGIRNKVMGRKDDNKPLAPRPAISARASSSSLPRSEPEELAPPKPPRPGGMRSPSMPSPGIPAMSMPTPPMPSAPIPMPSPSINLASKPKISPSPVNGGYGQPPPPPYGQVPSSLTPGYSSGYSVGGATPPSRYQTPVNGVSPLPGTSPVPSSASTHGLDYFGQRRASQASSIASSAASVAAAKKKPPPPVPTKRMPSQPIQYVTALFDFEGQSAGDLSFKEGDRIRVVKKTESTDDWWDGELNGRKGAFPANYVQL